MPKNQSGFSAVFILLIIILLVGSIIGGGYYFAKTSDKSVLKSSELNIGQEQATESAELDSSDLIAATTAANLKSPLPQGWKLLEVDSCELSMVHPVDWRVDVYSEQSSCEISIYNSKVASYFYIVTQTDNEYLSDFNNLRGEGKGNGQGQGAVDIIIDGVRGFTRAESKTKYMFGFIKGTVFFSGSVRSGIDADRIADKIFNSIKFTGKDYNRPDDNHFSEILNKNAYLKGILGRVEPLVIKYKLKEGKLPEKLSDLKSYLVPENGTELENLDLNSVEYVVNGERYSLSVKLVNGTIYEKNF